MEQYKVPNYLIEWLDTPCLPDDLIELSKDVYYMPIGTVKRKIKYMEDKFGVFVSESNFSHHIFNVNQKRYFASGSIEIKIVSADTGAQIYQIVGAATFPLEQYGENTHYAATLESLCILNAFGGKFMQFGSGLNSLDVVSKGNVLAIVPAAEVDAVTNKLFEQLKKKLKKYGSREEALAYLNSTEFKYNIEAKEIVNNLPLKK